MHTVYFCAGNRFATGDRIAAALLEYAGVLARTNGFDVVEIPTLRQDGSPGRTSLLLTPSSQISSESLPRVSSEVDPVDEELIQRLQVDGDRRLHPPTPQPEVVSDDSHFDSHFDF
jgi:hypothetical protein